MRKLSIVLALLFASFTVQAKQCIEYYRYNFSFNVANDAKNDLQELISQGFKIVSFSLDYTQKCMLVVYEDGK
jgi:hypothetical protein